VLTEKVLKINFFLFNLTSYSTTLRVISLGEGLGLNGFEKKMKQLILFWFRGI